MKENKQYRLKRWYPSLPAALKKEMVVEFNGSSIRWVDGCIEYNHEFNELELKCTDFWEEVKQPLFVTDDNIGIFGDATEIIIVSIKHYTVSKIRYKYLSKPLNRENFKYFKFDINANKYIEENKPKPLFITEDGVELFDEADKLFIVNKKCYKKESKISNIYDKTNRKDFKYFFHESNADEYIWKNKRVFSYEDMMKAKHSIILADEDVEKAAKKRSRNE